MAQSQRCPDTNTTRRRVRTAVAAKGLTEQTHKAACDINNIMARYVKTGTLEHTRVYEGQYADVSPHDYHESMCKIAEAKSMFEDLPARMRAHFKNDPREFLEFCTTREDAPGELQAIAEEYRKQALGLSTADDQVQAPPGGEAPSTDRMSGGARAEGDPPEAGEGKQDV